MMYREKERTRARELSLAKDTLRLTEDSLTTTTTTTTGLSRHHRAVFARGRRVGSRSQHCCFQTNLEPPRRASEDVYRREESVCYQAVGSIKENNALYWRERAHGVENCGYGGWKGSLREQKLTCVGFVIFRGIVSMFAIKTDKV